MRPWTHDRHSVIEQLAVLIEACGVNPFLHTDLLTPSRTHFPDPWSPTATGVSRVLGRLLKAADLDLRNMEVHVYDGPFPRPIAGVAAPHTDVPAWYEKSGDRILFGVRRNVLDQPERLVGTLAHEVGHAYRHNHRLSAPHRLDEERLTDLTTVYLGFGVLTVNAARQLIGKSTYHQVHHTGYLGPELLTWALAVQAIARGRTPWQRTRIAGWLEPMQGDLFLAFTRHLDNHRARLLRDLQLDGAVR